MGMKMSAKPLFHNVGKKILLAVSVISLLIIHTAGTGMQHAYANTSSVKGVLQGDSSLDLKDVQMVLKASLRLVELTSGQLELLGLDPDADVTLADARNVLIRALGLSIPVYHKTVSMLFVGNSYTFYGDVPSQVKALSKIYGVKVIYSSVIQGGVALDVLKNEAYQIMKQQKFDYVVLQGSIPYEPSGNFLKNFEDLCNAAKENGAIPVLYSPAGPAIVDERPHKDIQKPYSMTYEGAARESGAILVNAADAWVYTYEKIPNISLCLPDYYHHANDTGAYLTACVFASTLFDLHIKDLAIRNLYHGNRAISLGNAAWEFTSFYKENGCSPDDVVVVAPGKNVKVND